MLFRSPAFPDTEIAADQIKLLQGRPHFRSTTTDRAGHGARGAGGEPRSESTISHRRRGCQGDAYGLIVDRFLGERELVISRSTRVLPRSRTSAQPP